VVPQPPYNPDVTPVVPQSPYNPDVTPLVPPPPYGPDIPRTGQCRFKSTE